MAAWRTAVAVLIVIFTLILLLPLTTIALPDVTDTLNGTGDYDSRYVDGNSAMGDMVDSIYKGVLVALFGILAWGIAWVIRRESNVGRRLK